MADDVTDKIKSVLANPEMMEMLSNLMNSNSGEEEHSFVESEDISNIKNMMTRLNNTSDKRITLLNALRPYMKGSRANNIDKAVRMLKLTRLSSILKDL